MMMDLGPHIEAVARHLLGSPNKRLSTKRALRFGSHGKICVTINGTKRGTFYDHSAGVGGGVLDLIVHERAGPGVKRSSGSDMNASSTPMTGQAGSNRSPHSRRTSRSSTRR